MDALTAETMTAEEARTLVDRVRTHVDELRDVLVRLYDGQGWKPLGYASWDDLCDAEFEVRIALPRAERAALVGDLRKQGMPLRAIGKALGVDHTTVREDLTDVSGVGNPTPSRVTGVDGKKYPARVTGVDPAVITRGGGVRPPHRVWLAHRLQPVPGWLGALA